MTRLNETRIGALLTEPFGATFVRQAAARPHAEHGTAIAVGIDGDVEVNGVRGRAVIVPPDVPYALRSAGPAATYLFDPELASRIAAHARDGGTRVLGRRVAEVVAAHRASLARPDVLHGVGDELGRLLATGTPRPIDRRVARVAEALRDPDGEPVPTSLSAAHLRELFARDIGMPMRRYALWRRLLHALARVGPVDLTTAAHAGGFADLAHFSRTCRRMLGYAPSELWARLVT